MSISAQKEADTLQTPKPPAKFAIQKHRPPSVGKTSLLKILKICESVLWRPSFRLSLHTGSEPVP
jgi:hypothetical protein